jgi:predicted amidohydrolase
MSKESQTKVAALQWDIQRGKIAHNLEKARELLEEAAEDHCKLCVLPEMWASSFAGEEAESLLPDVLEAELAIQNLSAELELCIAGSNYAQVEEGIVNRARLYENGAFLGHYDKVHLFSPLGEDRFFKAGSDTAIFDTSLGKVGLAICYDLRFPEYLRTLFLEGCEILIVPSQWPEARARHFRILAKARAVENQCFVIATNRCGIEPSILTGQDILFSGNSMVIEPTGEVLIQGGGEEGVLSAEIDLKDCKILRRAIPVTKDRRDDVYKRLWNKNWK